MRVKKNNLIKHKDTTSHILGFDLVYDGETEIFEFNQNQLTCDVRQYRTVKCSTQKTTALNISSDHFRFKITSLMPVSSWFQFFSQKICLKRLQTSCGDTVHHIYGITVIIIRSTGSSGKSEISDSSKNSYVHIIVVEGNAYYFVFNFSDFLELLLKFALNLH